MPDISFTNKPTLVGSNVTLVSLSADHTDGYMASLKDEESMRLTGTQASFTRDQVEQWCSTRPEQTDRLDMAVIETSTGAFCGEVVILEVDEDNLTCGFRIALTSDFTGKGFGTEATRLIIGHVFDTTDMHRIGLEVYAFNPRAQHVYEKVGFKLEGRMRDALLWDGEYVDAIMMSVLDTEWTELS